MHTINRSLTIYPVICVGNHALIMLEKYIQHHIADNLLLISDGNFDIDTRLNADVGDLSHLVSRRVQIDQALVNTHLKSVVGVGTLTARGLAGHQTKDLGRHADWAGHLKFLADGAVLQLSAHSLQSLNLSGGKSDANSDDLQLIFILMHPKYNL